MRLLVSLSSFALQWCKTKTYIVPICSHIDQAKVAVWKLQEEMLLRQLPPMADLVKIFVYRDISPSLGFKSFETIFQVYDYLLLPPCSDINFLMRITADSRRWERWVLQQEPVGCPDYSHNCSLQLPSAPSCACNWDSFPVIDGFTFFLRLPGSRLPCPPGLPSWFFSTQERRPFSRILSLLDC